MKKLLTPQGIVNLIITIALLFIFIYFLVKGANFFIKKNYPDYQTISIPNLEEQKPSDQTKNTNAYIIEDFFDPEEDYDLTQTEIDEIYQPNKNSTIA